jgi:RNA polymerase sigma factor (TIGR02999 family)
MLQPLRIENSTDFSGQMNQPSSTDVTQLLLDWNNGSNAALEKLMPAVYKELRKIAARYLRGERSGHTLQPTALVHEAYIKLIDRSQVNWQNRAHFLGTAAQLMRNILVDHARARNAAKRGGGEYKVSLNEAMISSEPPDVDLIALDEALDELSALDPQQGRVIELRFFGGLSIEETAVVLGISPTTVRRDWTTAKLWLRRRMDK